MRTLLLAIAALPLSACHASWDKDDKQGERHSAADAIAATGSGTSRSFAASDFSTIEVIGPDNVDVKQGAAFSVRAEGDPKALDDLEITVRNGELRIGRKDRGWGWNQSSGAVRIAVTLPRLTGASITGSGDLIADKGEGDFDAELTGSGNLTIGALSGGAVDLQATGSGDIKVAGTATRLDAEITGSGDIAGEGLTATSAKIRIMGSGDVRAVVKGDADVSIMGSGNAVLTGGAKCKVSAMGPGDAKCS